MNATTLTWAIAATTTLGVITRPFALPEAIWAVLGALLLVALGLIGISDAWVGIVKGLDVYLFLIGMMLLSEVARREGLFDWLASIATGHAKGSPTRLFILIYCVGIAVTVFRSNDATAVVLTPAVYAACRAARVWELKKSTTAMDQANCVCIRRRCVLPVSGDGSSKFRYHRVLPGRSLRPAGRSRGRVCDPMSR